MRTPLEAWIGLFVDSKAMKDHSKDLFGVSQRNYRKTFRLLRQFQYHRILYEFQDFLDHYFAFLLFPCVLLLGLFVLTFLGMFAVSSLSTWSTVYVFLTALNFALWIYLAHSDPGRVVDSRGKLQPSPFSNVDLKQTYVEIMAGERMATEGLCSTCEIERIRRCKHCSRCNTCVFRMDHHCGWLNNCVGYKK